MKAILRIGRLTVLCLVSALASANLSADDSGFTKVEDLVKDGFEKLAGHQIATLMDKHVIEVVDIETDAVTVSKRGAGEAGMERKFEKTKPENASAMFNPRLLARAPALEGKLERKVAVDALVVTDGVRTYRYSIYKKQDELFAVRDIDHGYVFYKVTVK